MKRGGLHPFTKNVGRPTSCENPVRQGGEGESFVKAIRRIAESSPASWALPEGLYLSIGVVRILGVRVEFVFPGLLEKRQFFWVDLGALCAPQWGIFSGICWDRWDGTLCLDGFGRFVVTDSL